MSDLQSLIEFCSVDMRNNINSIRKLITDSHMLYHECVYSLLESFEDYKGSIIEANINIEVNQRMITFAEQRALAISRSANYSDISNEFMAKYLQDSMFLQIVLTDWRALHKRAIDHCAKFQQFLLEFPSIILDGKNTAEHLIECRDIYDTAIARIMKRLSNIDNLNFFE